jgi:hypothetical protein
MRLAEHLPSPFDYLECFWLSKSCKLPSQKHWEVENSIFWCSMCRTPNHRFSVSKNCTVTPLESVVDSIKRYVTHPFNKLQATSTRRSPASSVKLLWLPPSSLKTHQSDGREREVMQADIANHIAPRSTIDTVYPEVIWKPTFTKQAGTTETNYQNTSSKAKGTVTTKLLSSSGEKLTALFERHGLDFGRYFRPLKGLLKT